MPRRTFPGTREDTRAARGFVLGMLGPWRGEQLAADAALVVTELATNAVLHAGSAFSVSLALSRNVIRISVGDTIPLGQPGQDAVAARRTRPRPGRGRGDGGPLGLREAGQREGRLGRAAPAPLTVLRTAGRLG